MEDGFTPSYVDANTFSGDQPEGLGLARRISPPVKANLGVVSVEGAVGETDDALVVIEEDSIAPSSPDHHKAPLSSVSEEAETRSPIEKDASSNEESESQEISDKDLELIEFFLKNPGKLLSSIRLALPAAEDWTTDDFAKIRQGLTRRLAGIGVKVKWEVIGDGKETYYSLRINDGAPILRRAFHQKLALEEARRPDTRLVNPQNVVPINKKEILAAAQEAKVVKQKFEDAQVIANIVDFVIRHRKVRTDSITPYALGSRFFGPKAYEEVKRGLESMVEAGLIIHVGHGRYVPGPEAKNFQAKNSKNPTKKTTKVASGNSPVTNLDEVRQRRSRN